MSEPENNSPKKDVSPEDKDERKESDNILKILDELLTHTNSSRRLFLIFIASALFFGPAAVILGGVLLEHPQYNIRHLETQQGNPVDFRSIPGAHLQLVDQNGTVIRELPPMMGDRPHNMPIFLGLRVFIIISIIFAIILLFIAIKEYKFFSHWNKRFTKYKSLKDKVDKELSD
ncbi:MAG: hypothetical protein D4R90_00705 [Nitrosopumilales archaeon]|nr:MAG: hypothetical protein D4R90_00705 [Nitrosopumilales archaeon]